MLSGHREMVTWSLGGRRISVLRNSFLCWSPLFWLMCDSTTSFLSVSAVLACFPVKGNAGWLLLGEVLCCVPLMTLHDPASLVLSPLPLSLGGVYLCHCFYSIVCWHNIPTSHSFIKVTNGKWNPSPPMGMTSSYLGHFYCTFPKVCRSWGQN